ncbi:Dihydropteroate synthase [Sphingomonas antarctica]|uniref:dihydropteroate synthase n=1 Tax=Sphingomonas antarctica TaxID=2040274 RepID=UPI0039EBA176
MARYFRPTAFIDSPIGFDGQVARLAGGLAYFSAYEVIEAEGQRISKRLVPVAQIDATVAGDAQAQATLANLSGSRPPLTLGNRTIRLDQPQVMGILNVTPDSFSDGGAYADEPGAIRHAHAMTDAGAALIDVGGESTRPNADPVWEGDEISRIQPVVAALARGGTAVSIDTRKASVMEVALTAGAAIVNDVSALSFDRKAIEFLRDRAEPIVIMHSPDAAKTLHAGGNYGNVLIEVYDWLAARIAALEAEGIAQSRLIVDPGIGFGKSLAENLALLNGAAIFHGLGCPLLIGASRKRFIGALANEVPANQRLPGSLTIALKAAEQGAQIIRVHDVPETVQALKVWRGLRDQALAG